MMRFTHQGGTVRDTPSLLVTGFNFPEGPAFDRAGNLDIAHDNGSRVDIPDPQGRQIDHVPVPGARVTNIAFGGPGDHRRCDRVPLHDARRDPRFALV
jgi:sugar lactone lactonase YvrE